MEDVLLRILKNLSDRVSGPMHFRLYLQPSMAVIYAVMSGWQDAKAGKPPYFLAMVSEPEHRKMLFMDGVRNVGKVFAIAVVLDAVYQLSVLRFFYPGEAVIVGLALAIVPYLLVRGLVNRLMRRALTEA